MEQDFLKNKTRLAAAAVLVLNAAVLAFGGWFLTSKIYSSNAKLEERKAEIKVIYLGWQGLMQSQRELQKIEADLEKINGAYIPFDQPYDFINSLEELAKSTAVSYEISLVTVGAQSQEKEKAMTFQVEFFGSFNNFMHFLKYLENMKYYTRVEALSIDKTANGGGQSGEIKNLPSAGVRGLVTLKAFGDI